MMIPIYSLEEAKKSILIRKSIVNTPVSPQINNKIIKIFGKPLTPQEVVKRIINDVIEKGDLALIEWTKKLDNTDISNSIEVKVDLMETALKSIDAKIKEVLIKTIDRILAFHRKQPISSWTTNDLGGTLGQIITPIQRVGFYVPGGSAPLPSTIIHSVCPAIIAGIEEIIIVSPSPISPIILATCNLMRDFNIKLRVFQIGGVQAVAALTYGTESVPKVNKIVGPGNIFVTLAKREVYGIVGIDGITGPTEAVILADRSADPELLASDLLAQAEHDFLSIPILLTTSPDLANMVKSSIEEQIPKLSRAEIAQYAIENNGGIILVTSIKEAISVINDFAPEHLSIITKDPQEILPQIKNAGGVFLGESSCEVMGDYIAGPSHVMPTGGAAKFSSPLSVLDFLKITSLIALDTKTVKSIAPLAELLARNEELTAHSEAARRRI
ncbi:MAG TPA: histidinol dehydrogenase [Candidatus Nanopelagicaceae bacterium]|nr:histidinol dehydrogenase [Candidatus Nanopelagicaceae bacterium]